MFKMILNCIVAPMLLSILPAYIIYAMQICGLEFWQLLIIVWLMFFIKNSDLSFEEK